MRESVLAVKDLANRAGQGISMNPERMGEQLLNELECGLNAFLAKIPEELQDVYEKRYIAKYSEWLQAMSRTFSVLITGASKFNNRRHDKMNAYEHSARKRFETWKEKVLKRVNRQQRLVGWAEVERLQNKLDQLTELQEKMKAVNKIVRNKKLSETEQHEELEALGLSSRIINEIMAEPQYSFQKKASKRTNYPTTLPKLRQRSRRLNAIRQWLPLTTKNLVLTVEMSLYATLTSEYEYILMQYPMMKRGKCSKATLSSGRPRTRHGKGSSLLMRCTL